MGAKILENCSSPLLASYASLPCTHIAVGSLRGDGDQEEQQYLYVREHGESPDPIALDHPFGIKAMTKQNWPSRLQYAHIMFHAATLSAPCFEVGKGASLVLPAHLA